LPGYRLNPSNFERATIAASRNTPLEKAVYGFEYHEGRDFLFFLFFSPNFFIFFFSFFFSFYFTAELTRKNNGEMRGDTRNAECERETRC